MKTLECRYCRNQVKVESGKPAPDGCKNCGGPLGPVRRHK